MAVGDFGENLAGDGFVLGGDQDLDAFLLPLRLDAAEVVGEDGRPYALTAQRADNQLGLDPAGDDGHRYRCAIHDRHSSPQPGPGTCTRRPHPRPDATRTRLT